MSNGFVCFNLENHQYGGHWLTRRDGIWSATKSVGNYNEGGGSRPIPLPELREEMGSRLRYHQKRIEQITDALNQAGGTI